jgi:hypothetical protein
VPGGDGSEIGEDNGCSIPAIENLHFIQGTPHSLLLQLPITFPLSILETTTDRNNISVQVEALLMGLKSVHRARGSTELIDMDSQ